MVITSKVNILIQYYNQYKLKVQTLLYAWWKLHLIQSSSYEETGNYIKTSQIKTPSKFAELIQTNKWMV